MISDSAAIVLFAIRSAIKLGQQLRQAFVDNTKDRPLTLPLPNFACAPDLASAATFFSGPPGSACLARSQTLASLIAKNAAGQPLAPDEQQEVMISYDEFFNLELAKSGQLRSAPDGTNLTPGQFDALITIRQWKRGANPNPSTLQRFAGVFIEIGVDYFTNVPGALDQNSAQGKAIAGFLDAMSEINFSEDQLGEIPGRLFTAALDTISQNSALLSADPKVQELIKVTTKSLSSNVADRLKQLAGSDLTKEQHVGDWAELVFRSVLSSAGNLVLSDPKRYLGIQQGGQDALVTNVGDSILGLVLGDSGVQLDRLFSRQGLETISKSALTVLGQHPEILIASNNTGLQKLLSSIATQLGQYDTPLTPDMLPELTRMILEKTGENLPLLWPGLAGKPEDHLLLTAAGTTLSILSAKPAAGQKWTLQFSSADILTVSNAVLTELAANPTWLLDAGGEMNANLKTALDAALGVIRSNADQRLSSPTVAQILSTVIAKVGLRKEFFDQMPAGSAAAGQSLIQAALNAIFKTIFDPGLNAQAAWQVVRSQALTDIVNISLAELARCVLNSARVQAFIALIQQLGASLSTGAAWDATAFTAQLQKALA